ncbi:MAG: hypothetical protein LBL51_05985, partial [Synergistaceae bacterium]|nr:hypothetical protein [Synergistaceae bacterium]
GGFCLYVSDERCAFPGPERWKKVHAELGKFRRLKGVTLFLDREDAADWYGLYALLARLNNEDVTVPDAGGGRAAGADDLALFLRNGFGKDLLAPFRKKKTRAAKEPAKEDSRGAEVLSDLARLAAIGGDSGQSPEKAEPEAEPEKERAPDGDEEELESRVRALLRDAPMQMMGTGLLRARLNERGTPVSLDALLGFLGRRTDALAFFPDERSPDRGGFVQMLDD